MHNNHYLQREVLLDWSCSREKLLAETFDERSNAALVLKTYTVPFVSRYPKRYLLRLDISKYMRGIERLGYYEFRDRFTMNPVYMQSLDASFRFTLLNSPSLWDNGFGTCYYLQTSILDSTNDIAESIKEAVRTGISEFNIVKHMDDISRDALNEFDAMFSELTRFGIEVPPDDDILF